MKINKKIISLFAALAIALPMSVSVGTLNSSYAESIKTMVVDAESKPLGGVTLAFYQTSSTSKKIFTVKTKSDGKFDSSTLVTFNSFSSKDLVDTSGNLNLPDGTYYYIDEAVPEGYIRNARPVTFSVVGGIAPNIDLSYKKLPADKGQMIVTLKGTSGNPIEGASLELYKSVSGNYVKLANLVSDSSGLILDVIDRTSEDSDTVIEVSNGSLILPKGTYKLMPKNTTTSLKPNKTEIVTVLENGKLYNVDFTYTTDGVNNNNPSGNVKTGVKIKVINKNNSKPMANQEIAVYSLDAEGKNESLIFVGKTNDKGLFESGKVTKGAELLANDGVLSLKPGKYYYKLNNYSNAAKHEFTVTEGKVGEQVLSLNVNTNTKSSSGKSSNSSSSSLAKTGVASTLAFSVAGVGMITSGAYMLRKRK